MDVFRFTAMIAGLPFPMSDDVGREEARGMLQHLIWLAREVERSHIRRGRSIEVLREEWLADDDS